MNFNMKILEIIQHNNIWLKHREVINYIHDDSNISQQSQQIKEENVSHLLIDFIKKLPISTIDPGVLNPKLYLLPATVPYSFLKGGTTMEISAKKAKVEDRLLDAVTMDEYTEHPELYANTGTAVEIGMSSL